MAWSQNRVHNRHQDLRRVVPGMLANSIGANPYQRGKWEWTRLADLAVSPLDPVFARILIFPYISYTVNRPIGDSPKLPHKHLAQLQRGKSLGGNPTSRKASTFISKWQMSTLTKSSAHSIVVVKTSINAEATYKDPDLLRLQSVPMFLPIMRGTLNLLAVHDPEVLERLDPNGLLGFCLCYKHHLAACLWWPPSRPSWGIGSEMWTSISRD